MDIILAFFIFLVVMFLFYKVRPNLEEQELNDLNEIYLEAKTLTDSLANPGYPYDWNTTNVQRIGITNGLNMIDQAKILRFKNISDEKYEATKEMFSMSADYGVIFRDINDNQINISGIDKIGSPDAIIAGNKLHILAEHRNEVSLSRILMYNQTTIKMVIFAWR